MLSRLVCRRLIALSAVLALSLGGSLGSVAHGTGPVLRFLPLSAPLQIVLDRPAGHAFVSDLGPLDQHGRPSGWPSIHMLDLRTGAPLRTISVHGQGVFMVGDEQTSRLFVSVAGQSAPQGQILRHSTIMILDTRTGARVRTVNGGWGGQMLVDPQRGRVFVADRGDFTSRTPGAVIVLDARSGVVVRRTPLGHDAWGLVLDRRTGHVFITAQAIAERYYWLSASTLYMLNARDGTVLRASPLGATPSVASSVVDEQTSRVFLCLDGRLDSVVAIVDTRTGVLLRTVPAGGRGAGGIVLDATTGRVFLPITRLDAQQYPSNSALAVFDAHTGARVRTVDLRRAALDGGGVLSVSAGRVFLFSSGVVNKYEHLDRHQASLKLFDAASGALLLSRPGAYGAGALVDERTGHLFATQFAQVDSKGEPQGTAIVAVLDGRTARVLHSVPVGRYPVALALDDTSGHLFVLDDGLLSHPGTSAGAGGVFVLTVQGFP